MVRLASLVSMYCTNTTFHVPDTTSIKAAIRPLWISLIVIDINRVTDFVTTFTYALSLQVLLILTVTVAIWVYWLYGS